MLMQRQKKNEEAKKRELMEKAILMQLGSELEYRACKSKRAFSGDVSVFRLHLSSSSSSMSLGDAPNEVLSLVLNNVDQQRDLYQCALVNKNFYATANPLLWHEPQQATGVDVHEETILFRLEQSFRLPHDQCLHSTPLGHNVRKLDASKFNDLQDLRAVINNVPLLEELFIGMLWELFFRIDKLNDKDMEQIALKCPQLKCLSLNLIFDASDRFFDPFRHCTNLRELSILRIVDGRNLQLTPLQHCPLKKLTLGSCYTDGEYTKDTFFGGIPTLTHLDMKYKTGGFFRYCQTLPSRTLFPVLTDLRFATKENIDNNLVPFFKAHPLIRTLSIANMKIRPALMTSLATDLVHLQHLSLINGHRLPSFTKTFHRVEKLTLRCRHLNIENMAMYFPNLHYIHVVKVPGTGRRYLGVSSLQNYLGVHFETHTKLTYLDFICYHSVPSNLKVHLPRRIGGHLLNEDLDHIRETALGLVWIDLCVSSSLYSLG
ncbi:hypothetical protein [Absidia glauca]|uniref:F-box domain-containing protein n=1 Tax=Absidia glauca TaxID=4829 RepID=A0A168LY62_ABSGL|nr:hypothetical protein [Absidia glauca]